MLDTIKSVVVFVLFFGLAWFLGLKGLLGLILGMVLMAYLIHSNNFVMNFFIKEIEDNLWTENKK